MIGSPALEIEAMSPSRLLRAVAPAIALLALAPAASAAAPTPPDASPRVFLGARLLTMAGPAIEDAVLVVDDGTIRAVGPRGRVRIPEDAVVHDVAGRVLMPGLVDTHSHVGGGWGADRSDPIQPEVRILDSIDPRSAGFQRAQAGGLTTVNVMSGSGHLMSGQTLYVKLRDAGTIEEMAVHDARGTILGGMKMANGTNSLRDPPFPGTRAKSAALVRQRFYDAREYREQQERARRDRKAKPPERDLAKEALLEVLDGTRVVHHHTHRHDDIVTVLRLAEEFGFRVVLHHVSEAWKVADEIAKAGIPCSVIVVDAPGGKLEARDVDFKTGRVLSEAGVLVGFHTDDWITDSPFVLPHRRPSAVRAGMSRDGCVARADPDQRSRDPGPRQSHRLAGLLDKDADFIILNGDPL